MSREPLHLLIYAIVLVVVVILLIKLVEVLAAA